MKGPSMRKIAELAGVSVATVSYALNNKPGISHQTRQRILQILEEEQYAPQSGSSARSGLQKYLYLVIDDMSSFSNLFYASILDTVATAAAKHSYDVVLCNQTVSFQSTTAAAAARRGLAAGVIFFHDVDLDTTVFLRKHDIPFVIIDSHCQAAGTAHVSVDYETAVFTAARHLIGLGHQDLAFIGQKELPDFYIATFGGFCRAMEQAGLSLRPQWVKAGACDFDSAYRCMEDLLQTAPRPSGVVCATDRFALAAMRCAQDRGYSIPKDLSFVGVDDLPVSQICYPPLTTVHIDVSKLAEQAVEYLHGQISGEDTAAIRTVRSDELIVRASTGAAK